MIMGPIGTKAMFGVLQIFVLHLPFNVQILERGFESNLMTPLDWNDEIQISIFVWRRGYNRYC